MLPDYTAGDIMASRRRSRNLENINHVSGTSKKLAYSRDAAGAYNSF